MQHQQLINPTKVNVYRINGLDVGFLHLVSEGACIRRFHSGHGQELKGTPCLHGGQTPHPHPRLRLPRKSQAQNPKRRIPWVPNAPLRTLQTGERSSRASQSIVLQMKDFSVQSYAAMPTRSSRGTFVRLWMAMEDQSIMPPSRSRVEIPRCQRLVPKTPKMSPTVALLR